MLVLVAEGLSTRQAASALVVTEQAVTYHISNLLSKFGCGNRAGLVARAFVFGYLDSRSWPPRLVSPPRGRVAAGSGGTGTKKGIIDRG